MPVIDSNPDFPSKIQIKCLFDDEKGPVCAYTHGYLWEEVWHCPKCGTAYRAGRAMYRTVSAPFITIDEFNGQIIRK
jgi:hypothetical protein